MRFPKSIRWRLQLWYGALLVAVLCGFGFTAFHFEKARRFQRIDEEIQTRVSALVVALRSANRQPPGEGQRGTPPQGPAPLGELRLTPQQSALFAGDAGYYFAVWLRAKDPLLRSPNAPPSIPLPQSRDAAVRMRGEFRESFLFAAPVDCVLVGRSIAAEEAELRKFAAVLSAIGGAVLVAGLIGGWWLATRAIRPVEDIGATAEKIAAGDLSQRINIGETDSELGRLAGVLNTTFARLDTAFAQQARFTADAAHELRTPVTVLLTQAQSALTRERSAAEYRETIEACQRAAQRMRGLIESLLELARMDAGQEPLRRTDCDLSRIAADSVELIRPLAEKRGITIHAELSRSPCRCDAERITQVVTNLLANAVEYNCDGGSLRITTAPGDGEATLTVQNTGPGIPAADLPHVFERFHRADKARTAGHAGLGLAIAQAIVNAHGGSITAESTEGESATFRVKLPV